MDISYFIFFCIFVAAVIGPTNNKPVYPCWGAHIEISQNCCSLFSLYYAAAFVGWTHSPYILSSWGQLSDSFISQSSNINIRVWLCKGCLFAVNVFLTGQSCKVGRFWSSGKASSKKAFPTKMSSQNFIQVPTRANPCLRVTSGLKET